VVPRWLRSDRKLADLQHVQRFVAVIHLLVTAPFSGTAVAELKVTVEQTANGSRNRLVPSRCPKPFLGQACRYAGGILAVSGEAELVLLASS
jgi:hypothetical protein